MMTIKIIFATLLVGGFIGSCADKENRGFFHNLALLILFIILVTNHNFF